MKQEDKLKNTLQEYYDSQEVPYEPQDWEHASAQLAELRKNGKRRRLAIILVFLLGVSFGLFQFLKPSGTVKQLAVSGQELENPEHLASPAEFPDLKNKESKKENIIETIEPHKDELKNKPITVGTEKFKSPQKVETSVTETAEVSEVKTSPATKKETKQAVVFNQAPEKNTETNDAELSKIKFGKENRTAPVSAGKDVEGVEEAKSKSDNEEMLPKNGDDNLANTKNNNTEEENKTSAEDIKENLQGETLSTFVAENKEPVAEEKSKTDDEKLPAPTPGVSPITFAKPDTSSAVDTIVPPYVRLSGEGLFYELGAVGYYGWKGPEKRDARGLSPLLGINYMNRLSKKSSLSFGVQYLQVANLSSSSKTSRVSTYKYGEQSEVTIVTPTTLHYLVAPLRFHYFVDQKNAFGGGFNFAYLLNVVSKVTSYDEKPGVTENYKSIKLAGYTEGFSWYDTQLSLFYRRKLLSSVALQAEVFLGLTDIKQDAFFGFKAKERNSGLKLSVIYFAFKKSNK